MDLLLSTADERLMARRVFDPHAPLIKFRLLHISNEGADAATTLLSRSLTLDDRMVNFLSGGSGMDASLERVARVICPAVTDVDVAAGDAEQERIRRFLRAHFGDALSPQQSITIYCHGPYGSGKKAFADSVAREVGINLIIADAAKMLEAPAPFEETMWLLGRESLLQPALFWVENFDCLTGDDPGNASRVDTLAEVTESCFRLVFLEGNQTRKVQQSLKNSISIEMNFSAPDDGERKHL